MVSTPQPGSRGRVAIVLPYWEFWESSVPWDLRAERTALLQRIVTALTSRYQVVAAELVSSIDVAHALAARLRPEPTDDADGLDALLVAVSMAAPPAPVMALVDQLPGTPLVVWAVQVQDRLEPDFSHTDITTQGATVGGPLLTNVLVRQGRAFDICMGPASRTDIVDSALRPAVAAGRLSRSVLARVGTTLPGYLSVDADDAELERRLGVRIAAISPAEVRDRALAFPSTQVAATLADLASTFDCAPEVDERGFEGAVRVLLALTALTAEHGLAGGAFNCHVPEIRFSTDIGITPCLALGESTTNGVPWTCTGDIVTAVAMTAVQALGLPTLYHEIEAVDYDADEVILANSGEHDRRLCPGRPRLQPNTWFTGDPVTAPCALFTVPAGPATLVAFTQLRDGTPRFIAAEGHLTGRTAPQTGTVHAGFRFATGTVTQAWPRWAAAGANHHSALTCAHVADDVERMARHLGAEFQRT